MLILLEGFVSTYYVTVSVAILIAACLSLKIACSHHPEGLTPKKADRAFPNAWKLLLLCAVYGIAYGYGYAALTNVADYLSIRLVDIFACLGILVLLVTWEKFDLILAHQIALPAMAIGCLIIPAFPLFAPSVSQVLLRISYTAILLYTLVVICNLCRRNSLNPFALFCAYGIVNHISLDIGRYLCSLALQGEYALRSFSMSAILVCTAAIATVLIFSENSFFSSWGLQRAVTADELSPRNKRDGFAACRLKYGLTAREVEILDCLIRNMSTNEIASEFVLSTGTIKAHTQHIYKKMGIHTKGELVSLFLSESTSSSLR